MITLKDVEVFVSEAKDKARRHKAHQIIIEYDEELYSVCSEPPDRMLEELTKFIPTLKLHRMVLNVR